MSTENLKRAHLIIEGRVQGVFFRAFTRDVAIENGLKGWVKNIYDGNVEAVFEGDGGDIARAIARCYKGPAASHVTNIDIKWEPYTGEFRTFSVRY